MFRKVILFFFSPIFAVMVMVVPDAWSLCELKNVEMHRTISEFIPFRNSPEKIDSVSLEDRGWKGDWNAIEEIGERCAIAESTSGWAETRRLWNRMFLSFLIPFACFAAISYPLALLLMLLDLRRLKKGLPPVYYTPFYNKIMGMKKHFNLFFVVWMATAYYVFRYWMLSC